MVIYGGEVKGRLGYGLASGDLDGDGIDDLAISAPFEDSPGTDSGAVYILLGKGTLSSVIDLKTTPADAVLYGGSAGDHLGCSLALGDVNQDGTDDLLVGSRFADLSELRRDAGAVYMYAGGSPLPPGGEGSWWSLVIYGTDAGDNLGCHISAGDLNGDAKDDLVLGAALANGPGNSRPDSGQAYLFFWGETLKTATLIDLSQTRPDVEIYGRDSGDNLGLATAVGNLTGDGIADLIVGAPWGDGPGGEHPDAGEFYVIEGGPSLGTSLPRELDLAAPESAAGVIYGANAGDRLGGCEIELYPGKVAARGVAAAGDFNGDGQADPAPPFPPDSTAGGPLT